VTGAMLAELLRWARRTRPGRIELPWRAWARSLVARRTRVVSAPPSPTMLLALVSAVAQAPRTRPGLTMPWLEPRIALSIRTFPTSSTSAHSTVLQPVEHIHESAGRGAPPVVGELCRRAVRRIVEERRRVELLPVHRLTEVTADPYGAAAHPGSVAPGPSWGQARMRDRKWLAPSPELTLPTLPRAAERYVVPESAAAEVTEAAGHAARQTPQQPMIAPPDLERLTDQVVRQIDRRIVAHRERVGRI